MNNPALTQLQDLLPRLNPTLFCQENGSRDIPALQLECNNLAASLQSALFQQLQIVVDPGHLTVQVTIMQSCCTFCLDSFVAYEELAHATKLCPEVLLDLTSCWSALAGSAVAFLSNLAQYFKPQFNSQQALPITYYRSERNCLAKLVQALKAGWPEYDLSEINNIVFALIERFLPGPDTRPCTWHELHWLKNLLEKLEKLDPEAEQQTPQLCSLLLELNCNDSTVAQYVLRSLTPCTNKELTLHEQEREWLFHLRSISCLSLSTGEPLYPGKASLTDAIKELIERELKRLGKFANNISLQPPLPPPAAARFKTPLSVSQFAIFCKIAIEAGIIEDPNLTDFFKWLCERVSTTRTQALSPHSLRSKFYQPDIAAAKMVKEYLLRMMSGLNKLM